MESLSTFRKPPSHRTLGIEWECFFDENEVISFNEYLKFFYVTTDGSLNWNGREAQLIGQPRWCSGRELVSQPLTAAWLVKELERVAKAVPTMYFNDTCGIHVHVSRKWATPKKVDHLIAFLSSLTNLEYESAFGRLPNYYCSRMNGNRHPDRYAALNTTPTNTVEFRVFRSGDVKWAQYCVKLVNYMMENANHLHKDAFFAFVDMTQP